MTPNQQRLQIIHQLSLQTDMLAQAVRNLSQAEELDFDDINDTISILENTGDRLHQIAENTDSLLTQWLNHHDKDMA